MHLCTLQNAKEALYFSGKGSQDAEAPGEVTCPRSHGQDMEAEPVTKFQEVCLTPIPHLTLYHTALMAEPGFTKCSVYASCQF